MSTPTVYYKNLQGLRFFAALSVIIYHVFGMQTLNGHLGVILFFVLSGFLITSLLLKELNSTTTINVKYFIIRRCLRIWPLYFLILLITLGLLLAGFQGHSFNQSKGLFWYYIIFIPNAAFALNTTLPYAGILWSVGSEEQFYIVWPFIVKYMQRYFLPILLFIILFFVLAPNVIDYINAHRFGSQNQTLYFLSHFMMRTAFNCMATGALVAYTWLKKPGLFKYIFHPAFQLILLALTLFLWIKNYDFRFADQIFATLFALIIANLALNEKSVISLENRVFNHLGKISYGLYVYHLIVLELVSYAFIKATGSPTSSAMLFIVGVPVLVGVATLSYQYFEKFFLKIKDRNYTIIHSGQPAT